MRPTELLLAIGALFGAAAEDRAEVVAPKIESLSCGPSSLSVAARLVGRRVDGEQLELLQAISAARETVTLQEVKQAAEAAGCATRAVSYASEEIPNARLPIIVAVRWRRESPPHFVVLYGASDRGVQVLDYPHEPQFVPVEMLRSAWDGRGLYLAADAAQLNEELPRSSFAVCCALITAGSVFGISGVWLARLCFGISSGRHQLLTGEK
jgi:ABC-type bacteriocin/lantibiotic exporter with double-glycine peptidase domain